MSTKPVRGITVTRWIRRALAVILAWNLGMGSYDLARGYLFGLVSFACVLGLVAAMTYQTKVIRRVERANRPRPDYSAIAAMEREIYGETFEHDGAVNRPARRETEKETTARWERDKEDAGAFETLAALRREREANCKLCDRMDREHRSNLRWERPS